MVFEVSGGTMTMSVTADMTGPQFSERACGAWMRCMRKGEFDVAWEISDAIMRSHVGVECYHLPRHLQYVWDGTPLRQKRVLIRCYHGLGDTIQFIRYAPLVKARAARVIVWAQPALIPLLGSVRGIDELLPLHDGAPGVAYDVDVEVMELPHVFRTSFATIPAQVPYLFPGRQVQCPKGYLLAVGIAWRAGDWDDRRSIPFQQLSSLARIPGIALHILQRGSGLEERENGVGVISGSESILELARIMQTLDLIVSVDSMPSHLAGALGLPVWNLLHADADWRWMQGRSDSPWYPTMRLFRQERPGEWGPVVARVASELRSLAAERSPSSSGKGERD